MMSENHISVKVAGSIMDDLNIIAILFFVMQCNRNALDMIFDNFRIDDF